MKRVKGVEDLNIRIVRAQGIVGVGVTTRICIFSSLAAASRPMEKAGSPADPGSSFRSACCRACSGTCSCTNCEQAFAAGELNFFSAHRHLHVPAASSLSGAGLEHRMGRLLQTAFRRTGTGARLSSAGTPTASPSPTAAWSASTTARSASAGRTTATAIARGHDARRRRVHPPLPDPPLPDGFHRIRHFGFLGNCHRAASWRSPRSARHGTAPSSDRSAGWLAGSPPAPHRASLRECPHLPRWLMMLIWTCAARPESCDAGAKSS